MNRRQFLSTSGTIGMVSLVAAPAVAPAQETGAGEHEFTAGSPPGPVFAGSPVVAGPAPDAITILQPLQRHATGYLEYAVGDAEFQRVDAAEAGLLALNGHVLKFRLPPLPPGMDVRYRIAAHSVGWVRVREFVHGEIVAGENETTEIRTFRTLAPSADKTSFVVWNDTHENVETLQRLHGVTTEAAPDFLVWNGDQSNDIHFEHEMTRQFLAPAGLAIAERWPLAYARGNHDVRGPEARRLNDFTGTPEDRFYYAFRSGPVAALVMDTGEDKPDSSIYFGGMAAFEQMQERQAKWLRTVVKEPWFREAPFKVLFCHIPLWFTRDIFPQYKRWEFTPVCREAWLPSLLEGGVKLVISGHTHSPVWMPAKDGQPIGQLIGGGPQPRSATVIQGSATKDLLAVTMKKLDGSTLAEVAIKA
jgi:3',5'-cyclic AMP phosphodiesterase CpdA